jgi:holo-[acyl-carrier protein] synthase
VIAGIPHSTLPIPHFLRMSIFGIGTDIVECLRIAQMIERHGELFITRVYTPNEIEYCQSRKQATQHFAGRWAAKEAVLKALGTGWRRGISWRDVEIRNLKSGSPTVAVYGGARDYMEQERIAQILISISHCRSHATAYAIALGDEKPTEAMK